MAAVPPYPPPAPAIAASLPPEWGAWTTIWTFNLINGSYTGSLPASYANWTSLTSLRLERLPLSGPVPAEWIQPTTFTQLTELSLVEMPNVQITWPQLRTWLDSKGNRLSNISLSNVGNFSGAGLDATFFSNYTMVTSLVLSNLNLGGPVPTSWGSSGMGRFKVLDLSGNNLQGPLPSFLMDVLGGPVWPWTTDSWVADLSRNNFTGGRTHVQQPPACLYLACGVQQMHCESWMEQNRTVEPLAPATAAGPIPTQWSSFQRSGHHVLRLTSNALTGALPATLAALVYNADVVDLSNNKFGGAIPPDWWNTASFTGRAQYIKLFNTE